MASTKTVADPTTLNKLLTDLRRNMNKMTKLLPDSSGDKPRTLALTGIPKIETTQATPTKESRSGSRSKRKSGSSTSSTKHSPSSPTLQSFSVPEENRRTLSESDAIVTSSAL